MRKKIWCYTAKHPCRHWGRQRQRLKTKKRQKAASSARFPMPETSRASMKRPYRALCNFNFFCFNDVYILILVQLK